MNMLGFVLSDMFFAGMAAVGLGLFYNVPTNALKYCAISSALGHSTRNLLMHFHFSIELSTLIACILVGFVSLYGARKLMAHPKIFTVVSVIPMMPGVYVFKSMIALVQINSKGYSEALWESLVNNAIQSVFIIGAIAIGLAMPGLLFYRKQPVV